MAQLLVCIVAVESEAFDGATLKKPVMKIKENVKMMERLKTQLCIFLAASAIFLNFPSAQSKGK